MSYTATVFNVMLSSPSDVRDENAIMREAILDWNTQNSASLKTVLIPISWDKNVTPMMGDRPQSIINNQITEKCDILIAIFWHRIGTPTGKEDSGTIEEIKEVMKQSKHTVVFFSKRDLPHDHDTLQRKKLIILEKELKQKGIIGEYNSIDEFKNKFTRMLTPMVNNMLTPMVNNLEQNNQNMPMARRKNRYLEKIEEAGFFDVMNEIISESASNCGHIDVQYKNIENIIYIGEREFKFPSNHRETQKLRFFVDNILCLKLITERYDVNLSPRRNFDCYELTTFGYDYADSLQKTILAQNKQ